MQTDASDYAVAAILAQRDADGREHVIQYASRQLRDDEKRYDTREKDLLAIIYGCCEFRKYLWGPAFIVQTDHANLKWLMSTPHLTGRLARWVMQLQEFDFRIEHRPGRHNQNADALSRLPVVAVIESDSDSAEEGDGVPSGAECDQAVVVIPTTKDLCAHQCDDPLLGPVITFLKSGVDNESAPPDVLEVLRNSGQLELEPSTGLLFHISTFRGEKLRVPYPAPRDRQILISALHSIPPAGHLGRHKTYHRVRSRYYWKGLSADVKVFVRSCHACQICKKHQPKRAGLLRQFSASQPVPSRGHRYLRSVASIVLWESIRRVND